MSVNETSSSIKGSFPRDVTNTIDNDSSLYHHEQRNVENTEDKHTGIENLNRLLKLKLLPWQLWQQRLFRVYVASTKIVNTPIAKHNDNMTTQVIESWRCSRKEKRNIFWFNLTVRFAAPAKCLHFFYIYIFLHFEILFCGRTSFKFCRTFPRMIYLNKIRRLRRNHTVYHTNLSLTSHIHW